MRKLSMNEYYDVIVYKKIIADIDTLSVAIYQWINDFSDRKGLDHAWDEVSEEDKNVFINRIYNQNYNNDNLGWDENDIEIIESELCGFKGMGHEYDDIDSDIREEIRSEWFEIFTKKYL
jgi:Zn ribbon nucleic-acid-binding protein